MTLENFTTYDQTADPGNWLTVTANKVDANGISLDQDAWRGDDKGAGHFGATFAHLLELTIQAIATGGLANCWAVANLVADSKYWADNTSEALTLRVRTNTDVIEIKNNESGATDAWNKGSSLAGDTYWLTIERTGETSIQCRIYADSGRTSLVDTIVVAITGGRTYRYVFPFVSHNTGTSADFDLDIANLDLQEAAAPHHLLLLGAGS